MVKERLEHAPKDYNPSTPGPSRSQNASKLNPNAIAFPQASSAMSHAGQQRSYANMSRSRRRLGTGTRFGGTQLATITEGEQLTTTFAQLNMTNENAMNPSEAPGRSTIGFDWRSPSRLTTQLTTRTQTGAIRTQTCVKMPFDRQKFKKGQIITLPFHQPNLVENVTQGDPSLTITKYGPVYSKRRMAVVLCRYRNEMMCLPLYSWGDRGIESRARTVRDQYMEITNAGPEAARYRNMGPYPVLRARVKRPLTSKSCVCLAAGFRVDYHEDIVVIGALENEDSERMLMTWKDVMEACEEPKY